MEAKKQIIYLDNNATTPIDKKVLAMMPFLTNKYSNANKLLLVNGNGWII